MDTPHGTIETPCVVNCAGQQILPEKFEFTKLDKKSYQKINRFIQLNKRFHESICILTFCSSCRRLGYQAGANGRGEGASRGHASRLRGDGENQGDSGRNPPVLLRLCWVYSAVLTERLKPSYLKLQHFNACGVKNGSSVYLHFLWE